MKESTGTLYGMLPDGRALIAAPLPEAVQDTVRVLWPDSEEITPEQRRKIFAINGEIAAWQGDDPEHTRSALLSKFLLSVISDWQMDTISLARGNGCDKGMASRIIDFLISFCLENDVPTKQPLMELADDLEHYTYAALMNKRCLICGGKADLHHVDAVGMGYNRREKPQLGAKVMPLCRIHHTEYHSIGGTAFDAKYHTVAVAMDEKIAKKYNLTKKAKEEQNNDI